MAFKKSKILACESFEINVFDFNEIQNGILLRVEALSADKAFSPDTLIFESEAIPNATANALYTKLKRSLDQNGYSMPRSARYEAMGFSNEESILLLRRQTAHTVTDMFYAENE
jgi:hypothetical protein